ncbi:hypothetical protein [Streptosporangium roseum]|uniref:hypothetical protein n=1 Tax=Streptosporangium roseum TaxID=2001 RepID=UPI00332D2589
MNPFFVIAACGVIFTFLASGHRAKNVTGARTPTQMWASIKACGAPRAILLALAGFAVVVIFMAIATLTGAFLLTARVTVVTGQGVGVAALAFAWHLSRLATGFDTPAAARLLEGPAPC